jgi:hypothetical protein
MSNETHQHCQRESNFIHDHELDAVRAIDNIQNEIIALSNMRDQIQSSFERPRVPSSEPFYPHPSQHAHASPHQQFSQQHFQHHQVFSGQHSFVDPRSFSPQGIDGSYLAHHHEGAYHPGKDAHTLHFDDMMSSPGRRSISNDSGSSASTCHFHQDSPPHQYNELSCHQYGQHLAPQARQMQQLQQACFLSNKPIYMVYFMI